MAGCIRHGGKCSREATRGPPGRGPIFCDEHWRELQGKVRRIRERLGVSQEEWNEAVRRAKAKLLRG